MHHFMIGLGSTGGRILRDLRKIVRQEFPNGHGDPVDASGQNSGVRIGYLYVDSDADALEDRKDWKVLGESIQLDPRQRRLIRDGDLWQVLQNLDLYPAIKPWIGDPAELQEMFRVTSGAQGAGQIRRFGRFLFAIAAGKFESDVTQEVARLQQGGTAKVAFHLCGTLAGGTGSGSFIDAVLIIRENFPDTVSYPIYLYTLATDAPMGPEVAKPNFYGNQYAALLELGAMVQNYVHPHLLTGNGQRAPERRGRYQACYIVTNRNQNDMDLTLDDQQQLIAEYLFHRAVTLKDRDGHLRESWTYENCAQYASFRKRSAQFNSPGVKRWVVPTAEMREKIAMSLGASGAAQALYNNWVQDFGFRTELRPLDVPHEVTKSDSATSWRLAEDQIMLNHGFELSPTQEPVQRWEIEWQRVVSSAIKWVTEERKQAPEQWLLDVRKRVDDHLASGFRTRGVAQWFRDKHPAARDYAIGIRQKIESDLFTRWRNGVLGIHDIRRIVEALRVEVDRRMRQIDNEIGTLEKDIADTDHFLGKAHKEWAGLRLWASILRLFGVNVRARRLREFEQRILKYALVRTRRAATDFKLLLLQETLRQLDDWQEIMIRTAKCIEDIQQALQKDSSERCPRDEQRKFEKRHVREYEPDIVDQATRDLTVSQAAQQAFGARLRAEIEQSIAPHADFSRLREWCSSGQLSNVIDRCAYEMAEAQIEMLAGQGRYPNILKAGIIDTLRSRYSSDDEAMRRDIETFVKWAAASYKMEAAPFQPRQDAANADWREMPNRSTAVFLPINQNTNDPFEKRLRERFERATSDGAVKIVYTEDRPQEITVLTTDYLLPAHFFRTVTGLKQRYSDRCRGREIAASRQIHSEDWQSGQLTDLLIDAAEAQSWTSP
jgi:hypothetical protein